MSFERFPELPVERRKPLRGRKDCGKLTERTVRYLDRCYERARRLALGIEPTY
jgi:hypothetical protein